MLYRFTPDSSSSSLCCSRSIFFFFCTNNYRVFFGKLQGISAKVVHVPHSDQGPAIAFAIRMKTALRLVFVIVNLESVWMLDQLLTAQSISSLIRF